MVAKYCQNVRINIFWYFLLNFTDLNFSNLAETTFSSRNCSEVRSAGIVPKFAECCRDWAELEKYAMTEWPQFDEFCVWNRTILWQFFFGSQLEFDKFCGSQQTTPDGRNRTVDAGRSTPDGRRHTAAPFLLPRFATAAAIAGALRGHHLPHLVGHPRHKSQLSTMEHLAFSENTLILRSQR